MKRLVLAGLVAALLASAANLLVYYLAPALFNFPFEFPLQGPGSDMGLLSPLAVISATVMITIGAAAVLTLLERVTDRPAPLFALFAGIFLLVSLEAPLSLPSPLIVRLALVMMHLLSAAIITYVLVIVRALPHGNTWRHL